MSRIAAAFARTRAEGRTALMPFLTLGYPSVETTLDAVPALAAAGADMFELGVPFSDPLADGATIQRASFGALERGMTLSACLDLARQLRRRVESPFLLMGYYNPIWRYGVERLCQDAAAAGVDGLIVPDLPPEEAGELHGPARARGLDLIFFVAPTSTDARIARVARLGSGFIYCVSLVGITGARQHLSGAIDGLIQRVRQHTDLPLVVGFGISQPEHVAAIAPIADGVIVASALIDCIDRLPPSQQVTGAAAFIADLRRATGRHGDGAT